MTFGRLARAGLSHHRRTYAAVVFGVAVAVAVLAGSLLVGASVRASLASIATNRLGRASIAVFSEQPFTDALAIRLSSELQRPVAPLLALTGIVRHEPSGRRAANVAVYAVDDRFFGFHGVENPTWDRSEVFASPDLARELGDAVGDALIIRIARPTDIPLDSLHGRRNEVGRSIRLISRGILTPAQMGEFSLTASQGPARAVFVPLRRFQQDLGLEDRANTLIVGGSDASVAWRAEASAEAAALRAALEKTVTHADVGIRVGASESGSTMIVESAAGLLGDSFAADVSGAAASQGLTTTPVLTWLANRMTVGIKTVPYSVVTALDPANAGDPELARLLSTARAEIRPVVLNEWAARELGATPGSPLELEYYRWADEGKLVVDQASFEVVGILPMKGVAIDERWTPDYPGITTATDLSDWDPPFPINLDLIRKQDEEYWDKFRTAPKAFTTLAAGQALWRTRHGQLTSMRVHGPVTLPAPDVTAMQIAAVGESSRAAARGATDFGQYFSYFSFFLMAAAILLSALFFRLGVEQRLPEIGLLRAAGFPMRSVRRLFMTEGAVVAGVGSLVGVVLAIGWAALMMLGLRTWWVDAVGTTLLRLHISLDALAIGAGSAFVVALLSIALTVRGDGSVFHRFPQIGDRSRTTGTPRPVPFLWKSVENRPVPVFYAAALTLTILSLTGTIPAAGGFFGAGALMLVAGLATLRMWLRRRPSGPATKSRLPRFSSLAFRNAAWRPGRSLTAAGLVAAAVFLLVSVDSFRKTTTPSASPKSGTGGFELVAESALPIVYDLESGAGREAAGLDAAVDPLLAGTRLLPLRLRPGDDASCLNLYRPTRPRVVGVPARLIKENRFSFARVVAGVDDAARANPWTLLTAPDSDGVIPAIVDQTSLQYVLHAAVGDVIVIDGDTARPISLRIVASLDDSIMQGEILIGEAAFQRTFPDIAGYRMFLVHVPPSSAAEPEVVAAALESALDTFGFDAQSTVAKLTAYHRVENTYLSTFQALGGLGLVLGCLGLAAVIARNVLERRRELALLGASGFTGHDLQNLVAVEHLALVGAGVAIGLVAAAIAIAPVLAARGGQAPWHALIWLVPVGVAGILAAGLSTRALRRLPLVASLRSE